MFDECGFEVVEIGYIARQTVNKKEGIDAARTFIQAKLKKISR